jgi:hypothetical protein
VKVGGVTDLLGGALGGETTKDALARELPNQDRLTGKSAGSRGECRSILFSWEMSRSGVAGEWCGGGVVWRGSGVAGEWCGGGVVWRGSGVAGRV